MSYILDALKKAEAERQIGDVPSIHAPAPGASVRTEEAPFVRRYLPWLITGLLAAAILAYLFWSHPWSHNEATPAVLVQAPIPAPAPAPVQPAPAAVNETPAPVQAAPIAPAPQVAPVPEKPAHPAKQAVAAVEKPKAQEAKVVAPAATAAPVPPPAASPPETSSAATTTAPVQEEAGTVQDLPAAIQRELPPVTITGYLYARNPADRSAVINKKLLHEGESIAPDLVLDKLTPKGAVLNYKGYRYRISY